MASDLPLRGGRARANPWFGPGLGIAVAHELHEFLRSRLVAAAAVAALLRHRAANPFCFRGIWLVDPQLGRAFSHSQIFADRLAGFAGRVFLANIDVAIAHDCYPLLVSDTILNCPEKLHSVPLRQHSLGSADQALRFIDRRPAEGFSTRQRLKSRAWHRTRQPPRASHFQMLDGDFRCEPSAT